jgi:hypothetical protein
MIGTPTERCDHQRETAGFHRPPREPNHLPNWDEFIDREGGYAFS